MSDDIYFQKKAEELSQKIHFAKVDNPKITVEEVQKIIYMAMKEVARDQRYSCVDAAKVWNKLEGDADHLPVSLFSVIQNAQIKG